MDKDIDAFRTISEAAEDLDLPQHVLRFWELRFPQIKPMKRSGGRRYYRPEDLELLRGIKRLLYGEGYTIKGVQRILKEQGVRSVMGAVRPSEGRPPARREPSLRPPGETIEPAPFEAEENEAEEFGDEVSETSGPASSPAPIRMKIEHARQLYAALLDIEECERILAAAREG